MIRLPKIKQSSLGFTFIEVLIGLALLLLVFLSLFGAFQLGLKIVSQSRARITALALANQKIEMAQNLPYKDVGTIQGVPAGTIPETETINRNGIDYTVKTTITYFDDPFDGTASAGTDDQPNDYKKVKVKVSWPGFLKGEVVLITNIAPKGLEADEGRGNLLVSVFNAVGLAIPQADIHVVNTAVEPPIDATYQTNDQGQFLLAGAPTSTNNYQITITKSGYSTDRTYGTEEVANPEKPHATVLEGKLTEISFSIDKVSSFSVQTLSPWGSEDFSDSFLDQSKISEINDINLSQGEAVLATTTSGYVSFGALSSLAITPASLLYWDKFTWTDNEPPATDIKYQIFYASGTSWLLIPDGDLPNNSTGLDSSPVDLSSLATTTYSQLKVRGNLSTANTSTSPVLFDWTISWTTNQPTPIGNIAFNLRGDKIIGTDADENKVYKYSADFTTLADGSLDVFNLEWDTYNFTIDPSQNLDLVATEPTSQPVGQGISLLPDTNQAISLFLSGENSLLVKTVDTETLEPVFSAQVRLSQTGLGYDKTQFTDTQGKTLFIPLEIGTYTIEIQADNYQDYISTVNISGDQSQIIGLIPVGPN